MVKTCVNCAYYVGCLADNNSGYHVHDWCIAWQNEIPWWVAHPEGDGWDEENKNDMENGTAVCWLFKPLATEVM